jgi:hypothetical protein
MFSDIADGVAVVINSETGIYYGMNKCSTVIFQNLVENGAPVGKVIDGLKKINGAPADIEEKANDFIKKLVKYGILTEGSGDMDASTSLNESAISEDNFVFEVTEYADAQELLLADPIHDVKDETGWKPTGDSMEDDAEKIKKKKENEEKVNNV